ncbi:MAG: DUF3710 domain-containing protein [Propionibacteriaceae bacterium]|nr:DUF3710 domain-containing protein [Propionibacteriaceae bacterium]
MIFGRKKRDAVVESPIEDDLDPATGEQQDPAGDEWAGLDSQDWRAEGPFDISEVDLDADDVARIDLGALVLTPMPEMGLQLQVDEESQHVVATLATKGESAIEMAVFAAPKAASMLAEVRAAMIAETEASGGTATVAQGPFGAEIRQVLPLTGQNGERLLHVSRIWLVQGPRWLLRGVLFGKAAQQLELEGETLELFEFFANTVVRRDSHPAAAGAIIPMRVPQGMMQA